VKALLAATDVPLDCHLMIDDPDRWAVGYAEAGVHNVTVHVEAAADPVALAKNLRAAGALAGLSVKPGTPLEPHVETLRHFDTLLVMSVEPGFGGQSFIPEVLDKVRTARRLVDTGHLRLLVEIDGGINAERGIHDLLVSGLQILARALHINFLGAFGDVGQNADLIGKHLHKPAVEGKVSLAISSRVAEEASAQLAQQRSVAGQDPQIAVLGGNLDLVHLLFDQQAFGSGDFQVNLIGHRQALFKASARSSTSSIVPCM